MTPAQAAEAMAEAIRRWQTAQSEAHRNPSMMLSSTRSTDEAADVMRVLFAAEDGLSAALSSYEASAEQGTAWRREAPTVDGWYPFRNRDGSGLSVIGIRGTAALVPCMGYPLTASDLVGEWGPRFDLDGSSPIPAAQVVEAARKDGDQ